MDFQPTFQISRLVYFKLVKIHTYILRYSATKPRKSPCLPFISSSELSFFQNTRLHSMHELQWKYNLHMNEQIGVRNWRGGGGC